MQKSLISAQKACGRSSQTALLPSPFLLPIFPVIKTKAHKMPQRIFYLWIALLVVITGAINWLLNPTPPTSPSIGGGGYDLSKPVYTLLLWAFLILWTLVAAVTGSLSKDRQAARRAFLLTAIGSFTTIAFFAIYHQNIH
ncbi:hypothetical protein [Ochrobactrum sp. BTU1]|uniref:hypothetical protein n=1 Tax=Ochrobactrum sp. BTU1 TaxID=2840456 RepID=UPI001C03FBD1|nr:hypothetical protein KMS41_16970 [Ochrobactrum sp. BTU1]